MVNKDWYHWTSERLQLRLQVQTRASDNKFAEILEDRIKLRIMASSVNGKANEAIINFLSIEFRTPISCVHILRGHSNTKKLVLIHNPGRLPDLPGLEMAE
jgi:uncharacterized protein (TIGR00251 family)